MSFVTFRFRLKSGDRRLLRLSGACNQVWNYCAQTQRQAERKRKGGSPVLWPTHFDYSRMVAGSSKILGVHADSINEVVKQFVSSRNKNKKCPKFRKSRGTRRSLGWIPFTNRILKIDGDSVIYLKKRYRFWKSREIQGTFKTGAFVEDAMGHWYVTFNCEVPDNLATGQGQVGIDLGLKDLATLSDGYKIEAPRIFRKWEKELARQQKARNKKRVTAIYAKIRNTRHHFLHVESTRIARAYQTIVVGDVSASQMVKKPRLAKSVYDAGWGAFKYMLRYKARRHDAVFIEANERWTTQTCSACEVNPDSSPKGRAGLGMRHWNCSNCGASHDRDVNAAKNILRVGLKHQPPVEGTVVV